MELYPANEHSRAPIPNGQPQGYGEFGQPQQYRQPQGYGQSAQPYIITSQANVAYASPGTVVVASGKRPPNRLVLAWLVCLCCFWPTGICAIMYANQANSETDNNKAWRKFRTARTLIIVSIVVGLIWIAIAIWRSVYAATSTTSYYHSYSSYGY